MTTTKGAERPGVWGPGSGDVLHVHQDWPVTSGIMMLLQGPSISKLDTSGNSPLGTAVRSFWGIPPALGLHVFVCHT